MEKNNAEWQAEFVKLGQEKLEVENKKIELED